MNYSYSIKQGINDGASQVSVEIVKAPFPWFGGKRLAADLIWSHFGDIGNYVEPFFGSGAVFLQQPESFKGASVVNDLDGFICNFWRAIKADPENVAIHATAQVNEIDLQARHQYLVNNRSAFTAKLLADPEYFDAKIAGWWAWGCCCWIGSGWCADRPLGQGVNRKIPHLGDRGKGVNRQIPHLGNRGQGVNRQIPHLGNRGQGVNRQEARTEWLNEWFAVLQSKFFETRVTCGDWQRICSPGSMTRFGIAGILLDPPYGTTGDVYAMDSRTIADEVREWCIENGDNPLLRIALCGHVGQHESLEELGWVVTSPKKSSGYQGADDRERIWFSPHCVNLEPQKYMQQGLFI